MENKYIAHYGVKGMKWKNRAKRATDMTKATVKWRMDTSPILNDVRSRKKTIHDKTKSLSKKHPHAKRNAQILAKSFQSGIEAASIRRLLGMNPTVGGMVLNTAVKSASQIKRANQQEALEKARRQRRAASKQK